MILVTEYLEIGLEELVMEHGGTFPEAVTKGVTESLLSIISHMNSVGLVLGRDRNASKSGLASPNVLLPDLANIRNQLFVVCSLIVNY